MPNKLVNEQLPLTIVIQKQEVDLIVDVVYGKPFNEQAIGGAVRNNNLKIKSVTIISECKLEWLHDTTALWYTIIERELAATYDFRERYENYELMNDNPELWN